MYVCMFVTRAFQIRIFSPGTAYPAQTTLNYLPLQQVRWEDVILAIGSVSRRAPTALRVSHRRISRASTQTRLLRKPGWLPWNWPKPRLR